MLGRRKNKIFVIGRNKTGTTSMGRALESLGFRTGRQSKAELFLEDWGRRDFHRIVNYCKSADAFQDIPFSLDYTYIALDYAYPGSKFILTVRDSSEQWYDSLTRFHTRIVGKERLPTADDLKQHPYRETGWLWRNHQLVYGVDENTLYDRAIYMTHYESHIQKVNDYFRYRPGDLLTVNVSEPDAMGRVCEFLGVPDAKQIMPHLNSTKHRGA